MEDGPQIDRGTVFLWDTCHREIYQRNSRGKRFPREACFDLGDVKWTRHIVTLSMKRRMKTLSWRKDLTFERGTVFLRDTCHREIYQRNIVTSDSRVKRALTQGDVPSGERRCDFQ